MSRHVSTLFCDDVRNEVGNKQSFIGVYRGSLYVQNFPAILPRLCIVITIETPTNEPFKSLLFKILQDDKVVVESPVPDHILESQKNITDASGANDKMMVYSTVVVLSPLVLEGAVRLRVRVLADGRELKGLGLKIDRAPAEAVAA